MGLFSKLFGKKSDSSKNEEVKISIKELNIDTSQTPEKFLNLKDEIIAFLIDSLQEINSLEQEVFKRSEKLKNPNEPNQVQPGEAELWNEYASRHKKILDQIAINASLGGSRSFGEPAKYNYLSDPDTKFSFIMKSANRAVIETMYENGITKKEQFVVKKENENWKIDSKKYGFSNENTWYKDEL